LRQLSNRYLSDSRLSAAGKSDRPVVSETGEQLGGPDDSSVVTETPRAWIFCGSEAVDKVLAVVTNRREKPPARIRSMASMAPSPAGEPM